MINKIKVSLGFIAIAMMLLSCEKPIKEAPQEQMEVTPISLSETAVYTTAHNTDLKLAQTGTVSFEKFQQQHLTRN